MSDLNLEAIKARDKARTQGEWQYDGQHFEITVPNRPSAEGGYWLIISECGPAPDQERKCPCDQFGHQFDANYAFIAHASVDVPALIAEVERLREREQQLVECCQSSEKNLAAQLGTVADLTERIVALEQALAYYADRTIYVDPYYSQKRAGKSPVLVEGGELARALLTPAPGASSPSPADATTRSEP